MHWTAYQLVRMVNGLFVCWKEAAKQSGNEASQFFFKLAFSFTCYSHRGPNQRQHGLISVSDPRWCSWGGLLARLPCLYASVNRFQHVQAAGCLFGKFVQLSSIQAACKPFNQLPSRSISFQTVQPGLLTGPLWFV